MTYPSTCVILTKVKSTSNLWHPKICSTSFRRRFKTTVSAPTHYEVLKVPKNASLEQIKESFIQKSKLYHPDKHPGNEEMHQKFIDLNESYTILSDPKTRALYNFKIFQDSKSGSYPFLKPRPAVHRSKDFKNPYVGLKRNTTDWSDFYSTYGGGRAYREMKSNVESQYWKEYWKISQKLGGGILNDGPSDPPVSHLEKEMKIIVAILILIYAWYFFYSTGREPMDQETFAAQHKLWLISKSRDK